MRLSWTKIAFAALLPLTLAAPAMADVQTDKLVAMCKANDDKPDSCDCQVKAITDNADPRYLKVLMALADSDPKGDMNAAMTKALSDAGLSQEEFKKLSDEQDAKLNPLIAACKK